MVQVLHRLGRNPVYSRSMTPLAAIVLAAGLGTRMASAQPKVLHRAAGRSLLGHVLTAVTQLGPQRTIVVTGPDQGGVDAEARRYVPNIETVIQAERLGTGHAVQMAAPLLQSFPGSVLLLFGDCPNIGAATLRALLAEIGPKTPVAVLGFRTNQPTGYGRLITKGKNLLAIREELDGTKRERAITLCNSGVMAVDCELLVRLLPKLENRNSKSEYYLTDLVELAVKARKTVRFAECPEPKRSWASIRAPSSPQIEAELQRKLSGQDAMEQGATLIAPDTVFLSADTQIGTRRRDRAQCRHRTRRDDRRQRGRSALLAYRGRDDRAGRADRAVCAAEAGRRDRPQAHIGNFVEIKKAKVEARAPRPIISPISAMRASAPAPNIGAGTITCNYDGFDKHQTDIGAGVFIGSNTALVAPVKIGDGANIAAGSVITQRCRGRCAGSARGRR